MASLPIDTEYAGFMHKCLMACMAILFELSRLKAKFVEAITTDTHTACVHKTCGIKTPSPLHWIQYQMPVAMHQGD